MTTTTTFDNIGCLIPCETRAFSKCLICSADLDPSSILDWCQECIDDVKKEFADEDNEDKCGCCGKALEQGMSSLCENCHQLLNEIKV